MHIFLSFVDLSAVNMKHEEQEFLLIRHPKNVGLSITTAALFLAGEMAGSGVLALPSALIGTGKCLSYLIYQMFSKSSNSCTGWSGILLIAFFSLVGAYMGSRLGLAWEILAETFEDLHQPNIRDPYPLLAEKAGLLKSPLLAKILRGLAIGNA